jgi:pyruvate kinase
MQGAHRFRPQVAEAKGKLIAYALDTKGPEVRTAMLRGGKDIELVKGQVGRALSWSRAGCGTVPCSYHALLRDTMR